MSRRPTTPNPSRGGFAVTPNDSTNLAHGGDDVVAKSLFVGSSGNVKVKRATGDVVTYKNLPDATFLPVEVIRVYATDTTASDIIAELE